ncbi:MAG: hypothetical protein ACRD1P_00115, partial [Thermoanaerobaculia bacterium]
ALVCLALVVERFLRRSPGGEYRGCTGEALFGGEERQKTLQAVAFAAAFTSQGQPPRPAGERGRFSGGGGDFGGGGSSETF